MTNLSKILALVLLIPTTALSQTFSININAIDENIYQSESGALIVTEPCEVPNHTQVMLKDHDFFSYTQSEAVIITPDICFSHFSGCVDEAYFEPYIEYETVIKVCKVNGVLFLPLNQEVVNDSRAIYDKSSQMLFLYDVEIWENLQNVGFTYGKIRLHYQEGNTFKVMEVVE